MNTERFDEELRYLILGKPSQLVEIYERIDVGNRSIILKKRQDPEHVKRYYTIRQVLQKWGVGNLYPELLADLKQMTKWYENTYLVVTPWWNHLEPEPKIQKGVDFWIRDKAKGKLVTSGSYTFLNGTMSKHT